MLMVDLVEATVANIKNGTYKISRPLQVVYQPAKGEEALNAAYLQFLASKQAQDIISEEGYVSMIDNASSYVPDPALEGTINISGSTSLQPLMLKLAEKYKELQSKVTVTVSGGGSGTGYKDAKEGVSDFGMISEEFNDEKAPGCSLYTVAKDGIAVIVHKDNGVSNISLETLKNIYDCEAGESAVKTWAEVEK